MYLSTCLLGEKTNCAPLEPRVYCVPEHRLCNTEEAVRYFFSLCFLQIVLRQLGGTGNGRTV